MKKIFTGFLAVLMMLTLWGCTQDTPDPGQTTAEPTQTLPQGWKVMDGVTYRFDENGMPVAGWISEVVDGETVRYYFHDNGALATSWQEIGGKRYYFGENGAMVTGWAELDGENYYFGMDGACFTGLLNIQGKGYYFDEEGRRYSGWLEKDGNTYYFGADGVMATGPVEIEGQTHHFSPHGVKILLVNPWNTVPEGYEVELAEVTEQDRLETACAEALARMLTDCQAAGHKPFIVSAYRTQEEQEYLYQRKVSRLEDQGLSYQEALKEAAREVAVPGTSEHQLGLAVDIIDSDYGFLDEYQASMPTQKWLMEHCHEYGFILRYPVGSTEITGIIYEPWHYRYVGVEIAQEIKNLGITLEEYLGAA